MSTSNEKTFSSLIHLSTLTQYFIPFGNYICPIVLWSIRKNDSQFVDYNGKQVLNFQLSMLLYTLLMALIAIPLFFYTLLKNFSIYDLENNCDVIFDNFNFEKGASLLFIGFGILILFAFMKIIEFILIILAAVKASNGQEYKYPLTINFFK